MRRYSMIRQALFILFLFSIFISFAHASEAKENVWPRHTIDASSRGADGVRMTDVNNDNRIDIVTGWEEGGVIRVYLHPGPSKVTSAWPSVTVGQVASPEDAVFVDLNQDGAVDVVSSCEGRTKSMFVHWAPTEKQEYLNPSAWKTEAIPACTDKMQWMFCLPMDIDGKNGMDLVLSAKGDNAAIGWLKSPENPNNLSDWEWFPLYKAGWIMSLMKADMDGDGDQDILATDRKGQSRGCLWLENPGKGTPKQFEVWTEHRIGGHDREVMFMDYGDLNADGQNDIAIPIRGSELICYVKQNTSWNSFTIPFPPETGTGKGVSIVDVDLDGVMDIVFSCEHAENKTGLWWLSKKNKNSLKEWDYHNISGLTGTKFDLLQSVDLDEDGDLDVITCEERENLGVIWYENPTR